MFITTSSVFFFFIALLLIIVGILIHNATKLIEINSKVDKIDHIINLISTNMQIDDADNSFEEMMKTHEKMSKSGNFRAVYRSADGKFVAGSLKELLEKISNDPNSKINQNELDAIKKIFDQMSTEIEPDKDENSED